MSHQENSGGWTRAIGQLAEALGPPWSRSRFPTAELTRPGIEWKPKLKTFKHVYFGQERRLPGIISVRWCVLGA